MRPSDDKKLTIIPRNPVRRSFLHARAMRLPRPYRLPPTVPLTRLRWAAWTLSGLLIAGLIGALILIAHDNVRHPRPLPVVAAKRDAPPPALPPPAPQPTMPLLAAAEPPMPPMPTLPIPAPPPPIAPPEPSAAPAQPEPAPDPDVDLIATILMLTPPAAVPSTECSTTQDAHCTTIETLEP